MPLFRRKAASPHDDDLGLLLLQGHEMIERTAQAHQKRWGLGTADRWDLDQPTGVLRWSFADHVAEAPAQILASHSGAASSWKWAWDNESIAPYLRSASEAVREWGAAHGHAALTTGTLEGVTAEQAADLAAIAFRITRASGFYRAPAGSSHVFMTFGPVTIVGGDDDGETFSVTVTDLGGRGLAGLATKATKEP